MRVVYNDVAGEGGDVAAAFREGMTSGDASFYVGHGRYGTGPDFDRNFIEFRLYDADGNLEETLDNYTALEHTLRRESRDPWQAFLARVNSNRIQVDLSNAGNLRMESHAHSNEFGARLIQWALEQSGTPVQTGAGGQLAEAPPPTRSAATAWSRSTAARRTPTTPRCATPRASARARRTCSSRTGPRRMRRRGRRPSSRSSTGSSASPRPSGCSAA